MHPQRELLRGTIVALRRGFVTFSFACLIPTTLDAMIWIWFCVR
jgi:hypothetical protein